ncbi:MAG: pullulanase-type alpha-1,6-glucosidase, partial [Myxococcota bacterium]
TFRVWAPTARSVNLKVYDATTKNELATVAMTGANGVWSATEPAGDDWYGHYYRYEVEVYAVSVSEVVTNEVTDPYSVGLSTNSEFTMIVDLNDPATKPDGWDSFSKPPLSAPEDITLYELHIRDFSISDPSVPEAHRGKFIAFTYDGSDKSRPLSNGMNHLQQLAMAGLSHVHLLPAFDIATIDEDESRRVEIFDTIDDLCAASPAVPEKDCTAYAGMTIMEVLGSFDPTSEEAQRIAGFMYDLDAFNWGYDPFHYTAPEGSYATNPEGMTRIREFRAMVQALSESGLRTVMDVVYNHTNASGQNAKSVLDRVVPGYYHRLNQETGEVERSTCCDNTATEHRMMEKLMIDSVVVWARDYKVDSFRFDLMGHHMKANMIKVRDTLKALDLKADGVDGDKIYIYGEGWNFGEVADNQRGENATQLNMPGTGIATFSDRLRDGVRGGGPFDDGMDLRQRQGFATGQCYDPNDLNSGADSECAEQRGWADIIRVGMAGNLADFVILNGDDVEVDGSTVSYFGSPAGYTEDPSEVITYISAHDNQTLWDNNQYKLPLGTSMADRVRVQNLGTGLVVLGQGIPFIHAGAEILRSKSFTRDSFNSGDWWNKLDYTYQDNNWNIGMPRMDKDGGAYEMIRTVLAALPDGPAQSDIEFAAAISREMLSIRYSSILFRLREKADVMTRVDYHNVGSTQTPGVIVQSITDGTCAGADLDPTLDSLLVMINASTATQNFTVPGVDGFELHPVQASSVDPVLEGAEFDGDTSTFTVPARTLAVFVQTQDGAQGAGLPCNTRVPTAVGGLQADVFVRGTMNDWSAPEESKLAQDPENEFVYSVDLSLDADTYMFKIADSEWSVHNFGISGGSITPGDGPHTMGSGAGDITLNIAATGTYRFTLDATDGSSPVLTVDPLE